jgi:hypothetical protein
VIKSIATVRHLRVLGFAAGAVAIAAGAVWITASAAGLNVGLLSSSSGSPQSANAAAAGPDAKAGSTSAACNDFVSHFASDLGTSQGKVDAAFQKAVGQTLDDEVKNGDITQAQADAIKKKVAGQAPCALLPSTGGKSSAANLGAYSQALLTAAASALGITDQQLKTDLAQGMTLSQIAAAQNPPVTEAQFRTRLIAKLTPLLDAAVANKQLTSAQEQKIIQQLQTGPIPYWDKPTRPAGKPATASPTPNS